MPGSFFDGEISKGKKGRRDYIKKKMELESGKRVSFYLTKDCVERVKHRNISRSRAFRKLRLSFPRLFEFCSSNELA